MLKLFSLLVLIMVKTVAFGQPQVTLYSSNHPNDYAHDSICSGNCITFWLSTSWNPSFYYWEFQNGIPLQSTESNPTFCFNDTGYHYMKLKIGYNQDTSNYFYVYDGSQVTVFLCPPETGFSVDKENVCSGDCIQFTDTSHNNPATWQWYFEGGVPDFFDGKAPPEVCYDSAGVFDVTLMTSNGAGADTVLMPNFILVNQSPTGTPTQNEYLVNYNDTITLEDCALGLSYSWTPPDYLSCSDCKSPVCQPKHDIEYQCIVSNNNGCEVSCTYNVKISNYPQPLLPNAFTPNGDGLNDVFGLINAESYVVSFSIFNRWGQMVFHTNDPEQSWDGRFEGKLQAMDTYVYVVTYRSLEDGSEHVMKGSLTLLN